MTFSVTPEFDPTRFPSPLRRVGVIGCGVMGGSFALAASRVPSVERVLVTDSDPAIRREAEKRGFGEVVATARRLAPAVDLLVLAIPVPAIPSVARDVLPHMPRSTVLTDLGSVKAQPVREVESLLKGLSGEGEGPSYIGGHPMTGSEREGPAGADPMLFEGVTYVLTPTPHSSTSAFHRLAGLLRDMGARVLAVDPEAHDRLVAVVSHLPQVVATSLMKHAAALADTQPALLMMAGGGFRDATRIAGSNPDLWMGILRQNRTATLEALSGFMGALDRVRTAIAEDDWEEVSAALVEGREARALLQTRAVAEATVDVVTPVEDRPGSLAAVTTALGNAGINIEDVTVRHPQAGGRGALVIAVAGEEAAERARLALQALGFSSHLERR
ncbi:MAG: prephenate dehydrogenase [Actinomycetota bacterium]|nr:prephenate dehydrogenase [Actinomycetota bacterium]